MRKNPCCCYCQHFSWAAGCPGPGDTRTKHRYHYQRGRRAGFQRDRQRHLLFRPRLRDAVSADRPMAGYRGRHRHGLFQLHLLSCLQACLELIRGDYSNPKDAGEVSHFQALATALSGTVGLGNIAGVAIAVSIGGPGATFWMVVAGLLGMSLKFAECTLGVRYRNEYPDGTVSGGPDVLPEQGLGGEEHGRSRQVPGGVLCDLLHRGLAWAVATCSRRTSLSSSSST